MDPLGCVPWPIEITLNRKLSRESYRSNRRFSVRQQVGKNFLRRFADHSSRPSQIDVKTVTTALFSHALYYLNYFTTLTHTFTQSAVRFSWAFPLLRQRAPRPSPCKAKVRLLLALHKNRPGSDFLSFWLRFSELPKAPYIQGFPDKSIGAIFSKMA